MKTVLKIITIVLITLLSVTIAIWSFPSTWEKPTDIAAVLVALFALFTAVYTSYLQKQHNFKSLKPLLDFNFNSNKDKDIFNIELRNYGKGPAIVKSYKVKHSDTEKYFIQNRDFEHFVGDYFDPRIKVGCTFFEEGSIIKSEGYEVLVTLKVALNNKSLKKSELQKKTKDFALSLIIEIEYFDIYDRELEPAIFDFNYKRMSNNI